MAKCSYCDERAEQVFTLPVGHPGDGTIKDDFKFEIIRFCATHWTGLAALVAKGRVR